MSATDDEGDKLNQDVLELKYRMRRLSGFKWYCPMRATAVCLGMKARSEETEANMLVYTEAELDAVFELFVQWLYSEDFNCKDVDRYRIHASIQMWYKSKQDVMKSGMKPAEAEFWFTFIKTMWKIWYDKKKEVGTAAILFENDDYLDWLATFEKDKMLTLNDIIKNGGKHIHPKTAFDGNEFTFLFAFTNSHWWVFCPVDQPEESIVDKCKNAMTKIDHNVEYKMGMDRLYYEYQRIYEYFPYASSKKVILAVGEIDEFSGQIIVEFNQSTSVLKDPSSGNEILSTGKYTTESEAYTASLDKAINWRNDEGENKLLHIAFHVTGNNFTQAWVTITEWLRNSDAVRVDVYLVIPRDEDEQLKAALKAIVNTTKSSGQIVKPSQQLSVQSQRRPSATQDFMRQMDSGIETWIAYIKSKRDKITTHVDFVGLKGLKGEILRLQAKYEKLAHELNMKPVNHDFEGALQKLQEVKDDNQFKTDLDKIMNELEKLKTKDVNPQEVLGKEKDSSVQTKDNLCPYKGIIQTFSLKKQKPTGKSSEDNPSPNVKEDQENGQDQNALEQKIADLKEEKETLNSFMEMEVAIVDALTYDNQRMSSELEEKIKGMEELEEKILISEAKLEEKTKEMKKLEQKLDILEAEIKAFETINDLESHQSDTDEDSNQVIQRIKAEKKKLQVQNAKLNGQKEKLEREMDKLKAQVDELGAQMHKSQKEKDDSQTAIDVLKAEIQTLQQRKTNSQTETQGMEAQMRMLQQEKAGVESFHNTIQIDMELMTNEASRKQEVTCAHWQRNEVLMVAGTPHGKRFSVLPINVLIHADGANPHGIEAGDFGVPSEGEVEIVSCHPNKPLVATLSNMGGTIQIFQFHNPGAECKWTKNFDEPKITAIAWKPNDPVELAYGDSEGNVFFWKVDEAAKDGGSPKIIEAIKNVFWGGVDEAAKDGGSSKIMKAVKPGKNGEVQMMAWSNNGEALVTGHRTNSFVCIWTKNTGAKGAEIQWECRTFNTEGAKKNELLDIAISTDDEYVAICRNDYKNKVTLNLMLPNRDSGAGVYHIGVPTGGVPTGENEIFVSVAFLCNDIHKRLAAISSTGKLRIFYTPDDLENHFAEFSSEVFQMSPGARSLASSPDGAYWSLCVGSKVELHVADKRLFMQRQSECIRNFVKQVNGAKWPELLQQVDNATLFNEIIMGIMIRLGWNKLHDEVHKLETQFKAAKDKTAIYEKYDDLFYQFCNKKSLYMIRVLRADQKIGLLGDLQDKVAFGERKSRAFDYIVSQIVLFIKTYIDSKQRQDKVIKKLKLAV